jgi:hypothetical protein
VGRPEVITGQELQNPPAEQSASMQRGQAFAHDGIWAGFAVLPAGASTGWHHHGDYATYASITSGAMTVEFGPGGSELADRQRGPHLHPRPPAPPRVGRSRRRSGRCRPSRRRGATVFNVEGPDPTT